MKTIILKMSGPLQSWGTSSHFEIRKTDYYPSKSGIIGMIGASLGYRRDEKEKYQELNDLDFLVRIEQQGNIRRDYHIAQKYDEKNGKKERTYVTHRYYLEDAIFLVGISHSDSKLMEEIEKGLKNPYFPPYMGRRSAVLPMDFFLESREGNLVKILRGYEWQASKWYQRKEEKETVCLELFGDSHLLQKENRMMRKDRVVSFSRAHRQFGFRYESRDVVEVENLYNTHREHDVFREIEEMGEEDVYIQSGN